MADYEDSIKTIAKGAGIAFVGIFISKLLTYLFRLIAARYGAENYGYLALSITVATFAVVFCSLGLEKGVTRYVAYFIEKKRLDKVKGVISASLTYSLTLSIIVAAVLIIFAPQLQQTFFPNIKAEEFTLILRIVLLTIPLQVSSKMLIGTFRAFRKPEYEVITKNITESGIKILLAGILFILGFSMIGISIAYSIAVFCSITLSYFFLWKTFPQLFTKFKSTYITKELVKYSLPLISMGIFLTIMASIDTFMLGYFKDASFVGIYNAVVPTAQLMYVLPFAILTLFIPTLTMLYAKKKKEEFKQLYKTVTKWIIMCSLLILGIFIVYSKEILGILFGNEYSIGYIALIILSAGYFLNFMIYASENILMVIKKTKIILYNCLIVSIANIILNSLLIPRYGIEGAAIGTGLSYVLWGLLLLFESYHYAKLLPFKRVLGRVLVSGVISIIIFHLIKGFIEINNLLLLLLFIVFFTAIYLLNLIMTGSFEKEDQLVLTYFEEKIGIKLPKLNKFLKRFIR